jgi:FAD/FMN-containing dehydrogenase
MGVVTWANIKIETMPAQDKIFFASVDDLSVANQLVHRLLKLRVGQECLLLNNVNLAAMVAQDWPRDFEKLRASLPLWTLILVVSAMKRRPEEKIRYETNILDEVIENEFPAIHLTDGLAGFPGLGRKFLQMLRQPWPREATYWKHRLKGACQSLFFITRPGRAPEFISLVATIAARYGYPIDDIGGYIQPIEHNRACQMEFNLFYDPRSASEVERERNLYREAARILLNEGALFTRPYGELASLVYEKATGYATVLRRVKKIFDPNNIMNPGNLCF